MALLKFNYGVLANLKNVNPSAATAGNVYITHDERAMYVDIPVMGEVEGKQVVTSSNRIRIGDMRIYTYLEDLQTELSNQSILTETALYYVEKQGKDKPVEEQKIVNALFKWSNSENKFIQINDTTSLVNKLTALENTVAGHATAIAGINESINNINADIENITKENGIIDTKVKASSDALTELINGKVAQDDFNTLNTTVSEHIAAQATLDQGQTDAINDLNALVGHKDNGENDPATGLCADIEKNATDIADIKLTIESLTGTDGGSIGEQIDSKIEAAQALQKKKDDDQDSLINGLTTDLTGYKETVSSTYATKEELTTHAADAAKTYATKEELTAHTEAAAKDYATKGELAAEITRASGVEEDHEGRIAEIETFFNAAIEPETTIDNLKEILKYIEDHKGEAIDMAANIQTNTEDIEDIYEIIGAEARVDDEGVEVPATGIRGDIAALQTGLAAEITSRTSEIERIENNINSLFAWGTF